MTGYRAFSYRFVKSFPVISKGFEIETEMTIHTLDKNMNFSNKIIEYRDRPAGSESKLKTYSDGFKVLKTIMNLKRTYKPISFYNEVALLMFIIGTTFLVPVLIDYFNTGLVPRYPTFIASVFFYMLMVLFFFMGQILGSIVKNNKQKFEIELNTWQYRFNKLKKNEK
jgi:hypothetical protein